jgi:hypothetical protein
VCLYAMSLILENLVDTDGNRSGKGKKLLGLSRASMMRWRGGVSLT